jgi:HPt (histidine-containing phosphotransfer) domain-containing protein
MVANLVQVCDASDQTSVQVKPVVFASIREELKAIIEGRSPASSHPVPANSAPSKPAPAPEPPEEQTGDLSDENYASHGIPASLGEPDDIELLKRFVLQCNEHTETIEEQILSLEQNPDDAELINGIFRAIHSIKGDAGFLYLTGISGLAHDTETLLDRLRNKQIPVSNRAIELCLASVDALKQMIANLNQVLEARNENREQVAASLPLVVFGPIRNRIKTFLENPESPDSAPPGVWVKSWCETAISPRNNWNRLWNCKARLWEKCWPRPAPPLPPRWTRPLNNNAPQPAAERQRRPASPKPSRWIRRKLIIWSTWWGTRHYRVASGSDGLETER